MAEAILNIKALRMLPVCSSLCPYDLCLLLKVGGKLIKLIGDRAWLCRAVRKEIRCLFEVRWYTNTLFIRCDNSKEVVSVMMMMLSQPWYVLRRVSRLSGCLDSSWFRCSCVHTELCTREQVLTLDTAWRCESVVPLTGRQRAACSQRATDNNCNSRLVLLYSSLRLFW